MKYIIYIAAFLFCANAQAQGVSMFGATRAQDTSKTKGQLVIPTLTNTDTNRVLTANAAGRFYYVTKSNGTPIDTTLFVRYTDTSRSSIVTTYFYVDSLYNSIGTHDSLVKYSDSLTGVYITSYGLDTTLGSYVPYTGATGNVVLGTHSLTATRVNTDTLEPRNSSGLHVHNSSHQDILIAGAGGGQNLTIYAPTNFDLLKNLSETDTVLTTSSSGTIKKTSIAANYHKQGGNSYGAISVAGTNDAFRFDLEANNAVAMSIHNGGNVSVGSTTDDGTKFKVTGTFGATSTSNIGSLATSALSPLLQVAGTNPSFSNTSNLTGTGAITVRANITPAGGEGGAIYFGSRDGIQGGIRSSLIESSSNTTGNMIFGIRATTGATGLSTYMTVYPDRLIEFSGTRVDVYGNLRAAGVALAMYNISGVGQFGENWYHNGTNYLYTAGQAATRIGFTSGDFRFNTAPVGVANTVITWTERMRINNSTGYVSLFSVAEYADNAAAILGGLAVGTIYRTGDTLKIVH